MFGIGMQELVVIFVVALLIFGPKRLPELARSLGKGLAEFRKASSELRHSFMLETDPNAQRPAGPDARTQREAVGKPGQLVDAAEPAAPPSAPAEGTAAKTALAASAASSTASNAASSAASNAAPADDER